VEDFTINELLPALSKVVPSEEKNSSKNSSLFWSFRKVVMQNNLDVPYSYFWKELLRDQGFTVGRLDSRYKGIDRKDAVLILMLN
jgi:hypothetical protein